MNKPHKHAELIKAWANGAEIQANYGSGWFSCGGCPEWNTGTEYRIKPEEKKPVVRWLWAEPYGYFQTRMFTEDEARHAGDGLIKLEWSRTEFPE